MSETQKRIKGRGALLKRDGSLADVGWATQPLLDCNLENAGFYWLRFLQPLRIKRWDYYGITTPTHYYSFTLGNIGYLGQVFAYAVNFATREYHEETLSLPFGRGVHLPRNSTKGESVYDNGKVRLAFGSEPSKRRLEIDWPGFDGAGLSAEVELWLPREHESTVVVIPIGKKRFYYNRKVNCMPAKGWVTYKGEREVLTPSACLGNLDWGRGVWDYQSFWVWASASGFLRDGRTIGLNLGYGFGDTSAATENTFILNGRVHKLGRVDFEYHAGSFMQPWSMKSEGHDLELEFRPFLERLAKTDLKLLSSEVHQMFGTYHGRLITQAGEVIEVNDLIGFAEEHHARW
jgi:hypothetical protein